MNKIFIQLTSLCLATGLFAGETSSSDVEAYRIICQKAAEDETYFSQFKNIEDYRLILEHVDKDQGKRYLEIIRCQTPEFLDIIEIFRKNDLYGNPRTDVFEKVGTISSTTLRYMKVASDLKLSYGSSLNQKSIIEIGAGYGGLATAEENIHIS